MRIPSQWLLLLMAVFVLLCQDVWPENVVTLKKEAYVQGPALVLGDVAEVEGEMAEVLEAVSLGPAAVPGGEKYVSASLLKSRIRSAGHELDGLEVKGASRAVATTLSLEMTREMLREDLRQFIGVEMPWDPADAAIDIVAPSRDYVVSEGTATVHWRPSPMYKWLGKGLFRGEIQIDGAPQAVAYCSVNIEAYGTVVVAARDISRGSVISLRDLVLEKRSLSTMKRGYSEQPEKLVGLVARSTIFPGTVVMSRHVVPRRLIKRNQTIRVEVKVGGLVVRDVARAMGDGCEGDLITCQNPDSKEEFHGVVRKDGIVVVQ
jgi:flagella basal body P-ring formation protein FlgA